ncbi:peptidoglycan DD-metalloendopeptidase family protein [Caproiciproducens sp. AGMB10547]|uniref:Peptidoglycan DD-metalloendopeptidase family protein n=1 Tax=Caproiciproducens faecalis TaxID=2820301 RepID=A0ABS7DQC5_9FIRM|nr:peptidoglycan DD-metalloendopeptidase family protein [Caproiciproducens faecalis]
MQLPKLKKTKSACKTSPHDLLNKTADYLYIVGIQTVRILKRVGRRLSRFFRPFTNLCKSIYAATVGKRIANLKEEFQSIREGFSIARTRIAQAKKLGYGRVIKEYLAVTGKSFVRHRGFVFSVLNIVAPIGAILLLGATVRFWTGLNYGLVLAYDGQQVATIQDEKTFEEASEMVSQRMVHDTADSDINLNVTPTFRLEVVNANSFMAVNSVCDKIIQQSNGIIEEASGLYVNGELLGAVKSSADLRYMLQNLLNKAKSGDTSATAAFSQDVETINGLFPTTTIMATESMDKLINGTSQAAVTYTVKDGDTVTSIAKANHTTISELNKINNNQLGDNLMPGDLINLEVAVPMLNVQLIKNLTYEVPLSYKTVTIKDDSQYTDYSKVKTAGVNGKQKCVDKVYYVNGVEQKRDIISRTVLVASTDKVVVTGTKKRPKYSGSGVSSGSLMWPVPSLRTITTYFTWRWGSFHTGIDISGGSAYGKTIVAADGGTVVSAGWSNGYGYCVKINHGGGIQTLYGHASKILVSSGQRVSKGQAIALVGSTGNSTGPHCHFEVIKNGTKVNPLSYVSR